MKNKIAPRHHINHSHVLKKAIRRVASGLALLVILAACNENESDRRSEIDENDDEQSVSDDTPVDTSPAFFEDINGSSWAVDSFQFDNGSVTAIPSDAGWGVEFRDREVDGDGRIIFGFTCNAVSSDYLFSNSILTQIGNIGIGGATCIENVTQEVLAVENAIYQYFLNPNTNTFTVEKDGNNELLFSIEGAGFASLTKE